MPTKLKRREFLKTAAALAGSFFLGCVSIHDNEKIEECKEVGGSKFCYTIKEWVKPLGDRYIDETLTIEEISIIEVSCDESGGLCEIAYKTKNGIPGKLYVAKDSVYGRPELLCEGMHYEKIILFRRCPPGSCCGHWYVVENTPAKEK